MEVAEGPSGSSEAIERMESYEPSEYSFWHGFHYNLLSSTLVYNTRI